MWWSSPKQTRRAVREDEVEGWFQAALDRPPQERTIATIRQHVKSRNPVRWRRLQRDLRWVQKEMKKMGLNPEDARWLL